MRYDHAGLARALLPAVLAAGATTLEYFRRGTPAVLKQDGSPVTIADQASEDILTGALMSLMPGIPVIAEEASAAGIRPAAGDDFFLVDPLDGTREFTNGIGEFTINIGRIKSGVACFGIVYAPALAKLYLTLGPDLAMMASVEPASTGVEFDNLQLSRIVTRAQTPGMPLTIAASRSHGSDALDAWLPGFACVERINIGSSLKFCLVAEGRADLYPRFGPTKEWDTAAGHALVNAAGGTVVDLSGQPLLYGKSELNFLNPRFVALARAGLPLPVLPSSPSGT